MELPVDFNVDSITLSSISSPRPLTETSPMNSLSYIKYDNFKEAQLDLANNFSAFEGTLASRLDKELNQFSNLLNSQNNNQNTISNNLTHNIKTDDNIQNDSKYNKEPLVLQPFKSVYDVEIAVKKMRAYSAAQNSMV